MFNVKPGSSPDNHALIFGYCSPLVQWDCNNCALLQMSPMRTAHVLSGRTLSLFSAACPLLSYAVTTEPCVVSQWIHVVLLCYGVKRLSFKLSIISTRISWTRVLTSLVRVSLLHAFELLTKPFSEMLKTPWTKKEGRL